MPQTRLSQSLPPQSVPHTMLSWPTSVPHTRLSPSRMVPQTRLSPLELRTVPHTRLSAVSRSTVPQTRLSDRPSVPHTMLSPSRSANAPQVVPSWKAFAFGRMTPPLMRWLPQMTCLLHTVGIDQLRAGLRGLVEPRQLHGALSVQEAGALGQHVVARIDLRGVLQDRLDHVRRQRRVRLQHQRDRPRNDGRRHAGAGQAQIRLGARRTASRSGGRPPSCNTSCSMDRPARRCRCRERRDPAWPRNQSAVGPRELYPAILSSVRTTVPSWL